MSSREITIYRRYIFSSLDRLVECLSGLSEQELDWRPPVDNANSLYALAMHTLANAEENILSTLCNHPMERDRAAEFTVRGGSPRIVEECWWDLRERLDGALAALPASALDDEVQHPRRGVISGREVLLVVARHVAEHLGQAELTRDLLRKSVAGREIGDTGADRSVSCVVLGEDSKRVLLHLRGDIRLWSLPGGRVEPGEVWEDAVVRETHEETGYWIAVERLVGEYRRQQIDDTKQLFVGRIIDGTPCLRPPESVRLGWFPVDRLPRNRMPWLREYVEDAVALQPSSISKVQHQSHRQRLAMRALYALADLRVRLAVRF